MCNGSLKRVLENIIIIEDLFETHRRPFRDSETNMPDWRPVGDRHASLVTHRRPTCLIGNPSETDMPHRRPTFLIKVPLETNMSDWRPNRDRHVSSETNMPDQRPISDQHGSSKTNMPDRRPTLGKLCISYGSPMRHVGL